jgi:hypothetical protein
MARDPVKPLDWVLEDSEAMTFTILQDVQLFPEYYYPRQGEQTHPHYTLYHVPPRTGFPKFDLLLSEAMQNPTRNARYELDAEKSAQIAQSLWLSIALPADFTEDECRIRDSVDIMPPNWGEDFEDVFDKLKLLPQLLSRVSDDFASGDMFNGLLRIFHKCPLLEDDYSTSDELSSLCKQVITAAEKYLGPYSRVSVQFYTMPILLIQFLIADT